MGKKPLKTKLRVQKRNEEKIRLLAAQEAVRKCNEIVNPLDDFPVFREFDKNEIKIRLEFYNVEDISKETFDEIFYLQKNNMQSVYNSCSWGWDEKKKYEEMTEKNAKYLVAKNENNEVVGFSHFRFDIDYGDEVLYCYELQLSQKVRRKGLGKFFMQILELIAFKNKMKKVVLTVLKHNTNAVNFFHSLRYEEDETNPTEGIFDDIPYQILSKINNRLNA